jgi:hypothetical protein
MKPREFPRAVLAALAVVALLGALAVAETVYVKVSSANVYDQPDSFDGKQLARLKLRDKLERLSHGEEWDKVRLTDSSGKTVEGYVLTRNLSTDEPDSGEPSKIWKLFGSGPSRSEGGATAGAEGLGPAGREYTKQNNVENGRLVVEQQMDTMYDKPEKVDRFMKELDKFMHDGRLGDYAAAPGGKP